MLGLGIAFTMTFLAVVASTVTSMIALKRKPLPSSIRLCSPTALLLAAVRYDPILNLCYLAKSTKPSIILWAAPVRIPWLLLLFPSDSNDFQLAFDITVLAFMIYNSLSNPRDFKITLRRTLYRDGILFFVVSIRRHRAIYCACSLRPRWLH
jgi:hypothetical protein